MAKWSKIICPRSELALNVVLTNGQSFRWKKRSDDSWTNVLYDKVWLIKQEENYINYAVFEKGFGLDEVKCKNTKEKLEHKNKINKSQKHNHKTFQRKSLEEKGLLLIETKNSILSVDIQEKKSEKYSVSEEFKTIHENFKDNETKLTNYFQLDVSSSDLYRQWSVKDLHFKQTAQQYKGIRQLQQDPVENLFSFICSSNNNISRISSMVEAMCIHFGEKVAVVDGETYYSFPTIQSLAGDNVEQTLRNLKFGYRARYISETAKYLQQKDPQWLYELREKPYKEVWNELCKLSGVGGKVADCICLMSMKKHNAIPVDTHVFQLALRDYCNYPQISKHKGAKSVTPTVYRDIGNFFRDLWGEYAGWAQTVLFSAELPQFKDVKTLSNKASKRKITDKHSSFKAKKKIKISCVN